MVRKSYWLLFITFLCLKHALASAAPALSERAAPGHEDYIVGLLGTSISDSANSISSGRFTLDELRDYSVFAAAKPAGIDAEAGAKAELLLLHAPDRTALLNSGSSGVTALPQRFQLLRKTLNDIPFGDLRSPRAAIVLRTLLDGQKHGSLMAEQTVDPPKASGWDTFFQANHIEGLPLPDGSVLVIRLYLINTKPALHKYFLKYPQFRSLVLHDHVILPPVEEFQKVTETHSGFKLVFSEMGDREATGDAFLSLLAKGTYPMMDTHDLAFHWPKIMESSAERVADIARTTLLLSQDPLAEFELSKMLIPEFTGKVAKLLHDYLTVLYRNSPAWGTFMVSLRQAIADNTNLSVGLLNPDFRAALRDWLAKQPGTFAGEVAATLGLSRH